VEVPLQAVESLAVLNHFENQIQKVQIDRIAKVIVEDQNVQRVRTEVVTVAPQKGNHLTVTASRLSKSVTMILLQEGNLLIAERILPVHVKHRIENQIVKEAHVQANASRNLISLTGNVTKVHPDQADHTEIKEEASARMKVVLNLVEDHRTETEEILLHHHDLVKPRLEKTRKVAKDQEVVLRNRLREEMTRHRDHAKPVIASQILTVIQKNLKNLTNLTRGVTIQHHVHGGLADPANQTQKVARIKKNSKNSINLLQNVTIRLPVHAEQAELANQILTVTEIKNSISLL
jgi:hypothetical protein